MATTCFVETIRERCRVCYTCVRECPAKAIRIADGQAEVIADRCIACGNCVRVCSQHAKQATSSIEEVISLLSGRQKVAAILAPSFPAEFGGVDYHLLVGMLRATGFSLVCEVAFGADLVADQYRRLLDRTSGRRYISTTCPAIVHYIERYHPGLVPSLIPIVSPMVATSRVLHKIHGDDVRIVFIGPCIAKKAEAASERLSGEVDAVLTYLELRQIFGLRDVLPQSVKPSDFDPPHAGAGGLFPISRGILQAAQIHEDLMSDEVVAVEGRANAMEAIKEFEEGDLAPRLLEAICCQGCIMGAGINSDTPLFHRRRHVRQYVCERKKTVAATRLQSDLARFAELDLSREFAEDDRRLALPDSAELNAILAKMGKSRLEDQLNCGACGYERCVDHAIAIAKGLAESEMCLPYTIDQLRKTIQQLASTQEALTQSEKLASMGQLAAGIAHEVNNPLGIVLMYAHLLREACEQSETAQPSTAMKEQIRDDLQMILEQANRCKRIVAGLLNFARQNKIVRTPAEVPNLVRKAIRSVAIPESVSIDIEEATSNPTAELDSGQIIQVLTNLLSNAVAAMASGGKLSVRINGDAARIRVSVQDTGTGIPQENLKRIFDPFFTTKPMGEGTGLGLAVTYGIVKMHSGDITVRSNNDPTAGPTGSVFTVSLPRTT